MDDPTSGTGSNHNASSISSLKIDIGEGLTRPQLYQLVWSKPMTTIAKQFGVSDSYLVRVCRSLRVPRPARGHWVKIKSGKSVEPIALPPSTPGQALEWHKGATIDRISPEPTARSSYSVTRQTKANLRQTHPLIRGARAHFENSRPVEEGAYLKPFKKRLVDITTSKAALGPALAFANELYNALEWAGHRVGHSSSADKLQRKDIDEHQVPRARTQPRYPSLWAPWGATLVTIGQVPMGLAIVEVSESVVMRYVQGKYIPDALYQASKGKRNHTDYSWTTDKDIPSGRLRLIAYAPHWHVNWSATWEEGKSKSLIDQIPQIVKALKAEAPILLEKIADADRKAESDRQAWKASLERLNRQDDLRKTQEAHKQSRAQLEQIIADWANLKSIESFLAEVEAEATDAEEPTKSALLDKLTLARASLGAQDALDWFLRWKSPLERYRPIYQESIAHEQTDAVQTD